jgi:translation initiation factor IF-1
MDFYLVCLILGFAGMAFLAVGGLGHGQGSHAHGGHVGHGGHAGDVNLHGAGHAGALHAGAQAGHAGHAVAPHAEGAHVQHAGHVHAHHGHGEGGGDARSLVLSGLGNLVSPRVISSVVFGMGAAGLLAHPYLGGPLLALAALAGGIGLEALAMRPMWNLMQRFVSRPAMTLETAVMETAQAVTSFDSRGQGLISVELDGQITQVLGTLRPADREAGVRVRAGDRVVIEAVDAGRNRCEVSYLGS